MPRFPVSQVAAGSRVLFGVFGFAFGGIGLTVLGFLWLSSFDDFGSPPMFFRIVGSFIAIAFVAMGGTMAFGAFRSGGILGEMQSSIDQRMASAARSDGSVADVVGYSCPQCGAALGPNADVSPLGDTKCAFCGQWFNVYGRQA